MKKSWKKILCSLMLAPCMFWAVACGDNPDDPNNLTVDLTAEQQQEAYTTLRTLASSMLNNDGSKDQAYTLNSKTTFKPSVDISSSGLTDESKFIADQENYLLGNTVTRNSTIYGAYKSNNTGYVNCTVEENSGTEDGFIRSVREEFVKYNNNQYVLYKNSNNQKTKSYVDNRYAKNTIVLDKNYFENDSAYYQVDLLLDLFENTLSFEDYKGDLLDLSSYCIAESKINNLKDLDISEYVNSNYKFTLTDGVYHFELNSDINLENAPVVYLEDGYLVGDFSLNLDFDSDKITSIKIKYNTNMISCISSELYFEGWINQTFNNTNYVKYIETRSVDLDINFVSMFDENYYNNTFSEYNGTGANGTIQNQLTNISIFTNDAEIIIQAPYGDNLKQVIVDGLSDYLINNNLVFISAIVGIEEQTPVLENDKVPSYDIDVYVALGQDTIEYETTIVMLNFVNKEDFSGELQLILSRNLYESIKAVWGLTDDQIVGIYSDADLENKLPTSTLVSEGMTIYIVLEDGWSPIPPEAN